MCKITNKQIKNWRTTILCWLNRSFLFFFVCVCVCFFSPKVSVWKNLLEIFVIYFYIIQLFRSWKIIIFRHFKGIPILNHFMVYVIALSGPSWLTYKITGYCTINGWRRSWSDCTDVQANLKFCCSHMTWEYFFFFCKSYIIYKASIKTYLTRSTKKTKHCGHNFQFNRPYKVSKMAPTPTYSTLTNQHKNWNITILTLNIKTP